MEYRKHIETRIIRTEHHVTIWPGGTAEGLLRAIKQVPLHAQLLEVDEKEGTSQVTLIFSCEQAVERLDGDSQR